MRAEEQRVQLVAMEIRAACGDEVYRVVDVLTPPAGTRKARMDAELRRIREFGRDAVAVKLADRIANVEASWASRDARLFMYHAEWPTFREGLYRQGERLQPMWNRLRALLGKGNRR